MQLPALPCLHATFTLLRSIHAKWIPKSSTLKKVSCPNEGKKPRLSKGRLWDSGYQRTRSSTDNPFRDPIFYVSILRSLRTYCTNTWRYLRKSYRGKISGTPSPYLGILVALYAKGRRNLRKKVRQVSKVLTLGPSTSRWAPATCKPVAICTIGHGFGRPIAKGNRKSTLADRRYRLFHKMSRSRTIGKHQG